MSTSPQDDVLFGKIALNMRFIAKDLLEKALAYQRTQAPTLPLGELLFQKGVLTREQIDKILEFQNRVKTTMRSPENGGNSPLAGSPAMQQDRGKSPRSPGPEAVAPTQTSGKIRDGKVAAAVAADEPPDELLTQTIGGCQIVAKIGEGGMGAIYRARHEALRKDVVVKILPPESAANPRTVERFFREARAAAKLEHPNIVQVLNVGTTERGLHFIIMQYVDGSNLEDVIKEKGRHSKQDAIRIVMEVARGLQAAHRSGVIHRDIKADNILITAQGGVKLADFGLAKDLNSDLKLTAEGAMIGTPLYMAPEIGRVKEIDGRVDVYSLGVTFYYLLTGVQPFREFPALEILSAKAHDKLKPPEQFVPDIEQPVRNVLGKMLEKDRDKRYADCDAILRDLEALDRGFPVTAGEPTVWGQKSSGSGVSKMGKRERTGTSSSKRRGAAQVAAQAATPSGGLSSKALFAIVFVSVLFLTLGGILLYILFSSN